MVAILSSKDENYPEMRSVGKLISYRWDVSEWEFVVTVTNWCQAAVEVRRRTIGSALSLEKVVY
jgi:hypothetical protein